MSFANLKKSSKKGSFAALTEKLRKENQRGGWDNDKSDYWKLEVDKKDGSGYAVIRFLPASEGEEFPYVKLYKHSFKDPQTGKWYIENSLTTLGQKDPVSEANSALWNTGIESNKQIARDRKRQTKYITNILVISDPKNPHNEGKVFKFEFGPKIFQKIESAMAPEFEDEEAINPFDFWGGANFKLKAINVAGQRSYDKSGFDAPSELMDGDDEALEKLWKSQFKLQDEIAPDKFKSYEELKKRFDLVTGAAASAYAPPAREEAAPRVQRESAKRVEDTPPFDTDGGDDDLSQYASLLED